MNRWLILSITLTLATTGLLAGALLASALTAPNSNTLATLTGAALGALAGALFSRHVIKQWKGAAS